MMLRLPLALGGLKNSSSAARGGGLPKRWRGVGTTLHTPPGAFIPSLSGSARGFARCVSIPSCFGTYDSHFALVAQRVLQRCPEEVGLEARIDELLDTQRDRLVDGADLSLAKVTPEQSVSSNHVLIVSSQ